MKKQKPLKERAVAVLVYVQPDIHRRAKAITQRFQTSLAYLIRHSLTEKIDAVEEKLRNDEKLRRQDISDARRMRGIGERPINKPAKLPKVMYRPPTPKPKDAPVTEQIYLKHAAEILENLDSPTEKRIRVVQAISDVKKQFPLTHPSDDQILLNLEKAIVEIRAGLPSLTSALSPKTATTNGLLMSPTPSGELSTLAILEDRLNRVADAFTGKTLDLDKVASYGDVVENDENDEPDSITNGDNGASDA